MADQQKAAKKASKKTNPVQIKKNFGKKNKKPLTDRQIKKKLKVLRAKRASFHKKQIKKFKLEAKIKKLSQKIVAIKQKFFFALERVNNSKRNKDLAKEFVQLKRAKATAILARKNKVIEKLQKRAAAQKIAL